MAVKAISPVLQEHNYWLIFQIDEEKFCAFIFNNSEHDNYKQFFISANHDVQILCANTHA